MNFRIATIGVLSTALLATSLPAAARTQVAAPAAEWRAVAPENLLVIDTAKGRIVVEMDPQVAPQSVARIRTLADQGFYDGLTFHRVLQGFMAQTGDPLGTGEGGSELPDLPGEFHFRRGRDSGFVSLVPAPTGLLGIAGSMPIYTQPDAQMMVTADFKTSAQALFCPGVTGMARNQDPNSANSQFFLMTASNDSLNGLYTPFGRILEGMDVVKSLKAGTEAGNGRVTNPDIMTRVRTAAAMPEGQRPAARVMTARSPAFAALVEQKRTELGARFTVCDAQPPAEVTG